MPGLRFLLFLAVNSAGFGSCSGVFARHRGYRRTRANLRALACRRHRPFSLRRCVPSRYVRNKRAKSADESADERPDKEYINLMSGESILPDDIKTGGDEV